jgi:hypothetical protein
MSEARSVWVDYYPGTVQLVRLRKKTDARFEQQTFVIVNNSVRRKLHPRLRKETDTAALEFVFGFFSECGVWGLSWESSLRRLGDATERAFARGRP